MIIWSRTTSNNLTGEFLWDGTVRVIDMYWLNFVKTRVLETCLTRSIDMLVRHHSVPCSVFLEFVFKREIPEDSLKICFMRRVDQETCRF